MQQNQADARPGTNKKLTYTIGMGNGEGFPSAAKYKIWGPS